MDNFKYIYYISLLILLSCKGNTLTTKYPNGKINEEYKVDKDGRKDGVFSAYHDNGQLKEKSMYQRGVIQGHRTIYRIDGTLEIEETYNIYGKLDGQYRTFYTDGKTVSLTKIFKNDVLEGTIKAYYPNSNLKEEVTIMDNQENGPFIEYYQNGAIHWKGNYLNGPNEYGELFEFDSLGMPIKTMMCDSQAICRTTWKPDVPKQINTNEK
jgi:antitoxin component YwqK of YwqJK toxin-antitoxin module